MTYGLYFMSLSNFDWAPYLGHISEVLRILYVIFPLLAHPFQDRIRDIKRRYDNEKLVRGLPTEFLYYMIYLKTLHYSSRPDYPYLDSLFSSLFVRTGGMKYILHFLILIGVGTDTTPYDWETLEEAIQACELEKQVSCKLTHLLIEHSPEPN